MKSKYGPVFSVNFEDRTFGFYIRGSYGYCLYSLLKDYDKPFVFMDVGANQGLYSILAAWNPQCKQVFAFEPVLHTYNLLSTNLALNNVFDRVTVHCVAVSNVPGKRRISFHPGHTGAASLEHAVNEGGYETIRCISHVELDSLIDDFVCGEIIVKIDTEGHEPIVLDQLRRSRYWGSVTTIFYEVDEAWVDSISCLDSLLADGFEQLWRSPGDDQHYDVLVRRTTHRLVER